MKRDAIVTARITAAEKASLAEHAAQAGKRLSDFIRERLTAPGSAAPRTVERPSTASAPVVWVVWGNGQVGNTLTLRNTTP